MGPHIYQPAKATRDVLDSLRRIVQLLRESSRRAEKYAGVSGAQLFVLEKLAESPGLSLNELAGRTHTHQSSVSTVVTRLVEGGFVRRSQAAADGRRVELTLTPRGRRLIARAPGAAQERLIRSIEQLPHASRQRLAATLGEVVQRMDGRRRRATMFFDEGRRSGARRA